MTADKLGGRMDNDVGAMLYGAEQEGSGKGVVNNERYLVLMGYGRNGIYIYDVAVGVTEGLKKDGLGFWPEAFLKLSTWDGSTKVVVIPYVTRV